ncbi:O-methyltransferase [Nocardia panacis]|uniref:O-methyltransferase n=1 Tax=Nocardia panacis TaxID=2340916 RepID=UPI00193A2FA2|nr:class I SAM-dependent methyltransferase [Nocardia panacis]
MAQAQKAARASEFAMSCTDRTGLVLRTLAASKPGGRVLELGTGTGVGTAWLLAGMDHNARLITIESDPVRCAVARGVIMTDSRAHLHCADAAEWLTTVVGEPFDLAFVDCRPGKFTHRAELFARLAPGALYVVDDLLPQPTWPDDHQDRVDQFLAEIQDESELLCTTMHWNSGMLLGVKASE